MTGCGMHHSEFDPDRVLGVATERTAECARRLGGRGGFRRGMLQAVNDALAQMFPTLEPMLQHLSWNGTPQGQVRAALRLGSFDKGTGH